MMTQTGEVFGEFRFLKGFVEFHRPAAVDVYPSFRGGRG
jgi:hypothetical protein